MAIAYVQENASQTGAIAATTTEVISITTAPAGRNLLVLHHATNSAGTTPTASVVDTKGNTWTVNIGPTNGGSSIGEYGFIASTPQDVGILTTSDTVTITYDTAPTTQRLSMIEEFSGLGAVDVTIHTTNASSTTMQTGAVTPTSLGDLLIGGFSVPNTTVTYNATGTVGTYLNYTTSSLTSTGATNNRTLAACYQIDPNGSLISQNCKLTLSVAHTGEGYFVSFKAAPAPVGRETIVFAAAVLL